MKKFRTILVFLSIFCMFFESVYATNRYVNLTLTYDYTKHKYNEEEVFVAVDGNKLTGLQMPPIILNNYTLVPAREVFEAVGAKVEWVKDVEQVYVSYGSKLVVIPINSNKGYINGIEAMMQTNAKIINNKTMIPLRFVSTAVGFDIEWDKNTRIANIITNDAETTTQATTTTETTIETTTTTTTVTTTETTTQATTETTTQSAPVSIDSISLSTSNGRDTITIEGSGPVSPEGVMSSDKAAFNITIDNATLNIEKGNLPGGTYAKSGYYYQSGSKVAINLLVRENVGLKSVNYGNKTIITVDFLSENTITNGSTSVGYNESTGEIVIGNGSSVNVNSIIHSDDYYNHIYKMTINGNYTNSIKSGDYNVNNDYISSVNVDVSTDKTVITINENRILAYDIYNNSGALTIKPMLPKEKYDKIIVLDAGHGGSDPGASGQGLVEKDLTLNMLLKSKELFDKDGTIKCYVTRATDTYPSFDDRTNLGNEVGDAFISIHINSATSASPSGTETYCLNANDKGNGLTSQILAKELLNNLLENLGTVNRKVKSENFIVLRQSNIPASLIEIGFITNSGDAAIMGTESGQQAVANAVFTAVKDLFNTYPPVR